MSEQPTAMDLWKASRHESTLCKVDGVYFFGDAIIEMHFALERGEMAMSQLRSERDEFAHRIATMKEIIARLERERAAEIEGRKKAEAKLKDAQQLLGEWENHVGPYMEAEIERLTRERDDAIDALRGVAASNAEFIIRLRDISQAIKGDSHD